MDKIIIIIIIIIIINNNNDNNSNDNNNDNNACLFQPIAVNYRKGQLITIINNGQWIISMKTKTMNTIRTAAVKISRVELD